MQHATYAGAKQRVSVGWCHVPVQQFDPWKRDINDRYEIWPVPEMVQVGRRFRNGRLQAGISQRRLAARAGVSQSLISRLERGLATGTSAERLVRIATAIGPYFPFGHCPHGHRCAYPYDPTKTSAQLDVS